MFSIKEHIQVNYPAQEQAINSCPAAQYLNETPENRKEEQTGGGGGGGHQWVNFNASSVTKCVLEGSSKMSAY